MPLDEREQQILDDIERHLMEEDPELVETVEGLGETPRPRIALPLTGIIMGLAFVIVVFRINPLIALLGFLLMVFSATHLVRGFRTSGGFEDGGIGVSVPRRMRRLRRNNK